MIQIFTIMMLMSSAVTRIDYIHGSAPWVRSWIIEQWDRGHFNPYRGLTLSSSVGKFQLDPGTQEPMTWAAKKCPSSQQLFNSILQIESECSDSDKDDDDECQWWSWYCLQGSGARRYKRPQFVLVAGILSGGQTKAQLAQNHCMVMRTVIMDKWSKVSFTWY